MQKRAILIVTANRDYLKFYNCTLTAEKRQKGENERFTI